MRDVDHTVRIKDRACSCGARFRNGRELRKHVNAALKAQARRREKAPA